MRYVFIGCLSIGLALWWDRLLFNLGIKSRNRICIGVPIGEELIKFLFCLFFHLRPMIFYAVFGLEEGFYETMRIKKPFDLLLFGTGVFTHWFFSIFFLLKVPIMINLALAILSHMAWNRLILTSNKCDIV